jgi:hypothetical protein
MIHLINIDEVVHFRIRKYSENLSISMFSLRDSKRKENISFSQGRILKRREAYKDFNSIYC